MKMKEFRQKTQAIADDTELLVLGERHFTIGWCGNWCRQEDAVEWNIIPPLTAAALVHLKKVLADYPIIVNEEDLEKTDSTI